MRSEFHIGHKAVSRRVFINSVFDFSINIGECFYTPHNDNRECIKRKNISKISDGVRFVFSYKSVYKCDSAYRNKNNYQP